MNIPAVSDFIGRVRIIPRLALSLALMASGGCATSILLHPDTAREAVRKYPVDPASYGDQPEPVAVTNVFGHRLVGWAFSAATNSGVILVGDGNASGIAHTYGYNRYLLNQGFNVVILSYQGFDSNEGGADIDSLYGDVEAFYSFCRLRFPGQRVGLVAESISTAPFFAFACRHPEVFALVLEGAVNLRAVGFEKLNDWWLMYPIYPVGLCLATTVSLGVPSDLSVSQAMAQPSAVPILFLHHPRDEVTPWREARRMFEQYRGPKQWLTLESEGPGTFHSIGARDPEVRRRVIDFLSAELLR